MGSIEQNQTQIEQSQNLEKNFINNYLDIATSKIPKNANLSNSFRPFKFNEHSENGFEIKKTNPGDIYITIDSENYVIFNNREFDKIIKEYENIYGEQLDNHYPKLSLKKIFLMKLNNLYRKNSIKNKSLSLKNELYSNIA